jgi:hypothetical protein
MGLLPNIVIHVAAGYEAYFGPTQMGGQGTGLVGCPATIRTSCLSIYEDRSLYALLSIV